MAKYFDKEVLIRLTLAVFLLVFLKSWEPGLGNSSTGYGSMARNLAENGGFFHLKLSEDFFNPFMDHPPLTMWLMSGLFKLFGSSAQTVRLLSSIAAIIIFLCLFLVSSSAFGQRAGVFTVLSLLTVNVFMNYTASGWLDMPMIGFCWAGFALMYFGNLRQERWKMFLGAFLLGCAVLAKGVCALAVFPLFIFIFGRLVLERKILSGFILGITVVAPVALFSMVHFYYNGNIFWINYLVREAVENTDVIPNFVGYLWHFKETFRFGHLVSVLGFIGAFNLIRSKKLSWGWMILGGVFIHNLGYSWSSRHYSQYVTPVFPFLALGSGIVLAKIFGSISERVLAKWALRLSVFIFVLVDLFPIRVKSGNENPFRSMQSTLRIMKDNKNVYFVGDMAKQETWEDPASYIVWYWGRNPRIRKFEEVFQILESQDPQALGLVDTNELEQNRALFEKYTAVKICMYNDKITLLAQENICDDRVRSYRFRELPRAQWERAP